MNTKKLVAAAVTMGLATTGSLASFTGTAVAARASAKSLIATTRSVPTWTRTGSGCSISLIPQNSSSVAISRLSGQPFGGTALFDGGAVLYSSPAGLFNCVLTPRAPQMAPVFAPDAGTSRLSGLSYGGAALFS